MDRDPHLVNSALYGLMGANLAVFGAEQYARSTGNYRLRLFIDRNFVCSRTRPIWTLVTSGFHHADASHLAVNMLGLYFFGGAVGAAIGASRLVAMYMACSAAGAWLHNRASAFNAGVRGASSAVVGYTIFYAAANPTGTIFVMLVPVPARVYAMGFLALELMQVSARDGISHWAHLGGAAAGLAAFVACRRGFATWPFGRRLV